MAPAIELAEDLHGAIVAMVTTYLTWVFEQPVLARFMFQVRSQVAAGNFKTTWMSATSSAMHACWPI
jgi:hypothetical protein